MKHKIDYSIYLVTDRELMQTKTLEESIEQAILGGCTIVQLREKELSSRDFYALGLRVKEITDRHKIPLIINDRIDIAMAIDAHGVHVGQSDLPTAVARQIIGDEKILGISVSTLEQAVQAKRAGADYIGVGAMFKTSTKTDAEIVSMETLEAITRDVDIPCVVIGGINEETIPLFRDIPIDGISVVSAILSQPDVTQATAALKTLFLDHRRPVEHHVSAAIFDLDGTLLDSMGVWGKIDTLFLEKRGFVPSEEYVSTIAAMSLTEAAEHTIHHFQLEESVISVLKEWDHMATQEYTYDVELLPHTLEYLKELQKKGIKLAVATGLTQKLYEPVLKRLGIYDWFDVICSVSEVGTGKTTPAVFDLTIQKLGVPSSECIIFDDLLVAVKSAKETGARVYGVYDSYSKSDQTEIEKIADGYVLDFRSAPICLHAKK